MNSWLVRSGGDNSLIDQFLSENFVSIGWADVADTTKMTERDEYRVAYQTAYPSHSSRRVGVNSGQIYRFEKEIAIDDYVLTFDKFNRTYHVGKCTKPPKYDDKVNEDYPRIRTVKWLGSFSRSSLSESAQNSFGSVLTVFSISGYTDEIEACLKGNSVQSEPEVSEPEEIVSLYEDFRSKSDERISDLVSQLDPYDFQYLVGAIFRSMGFKTIEKDPGRDRGIDIIAYKDDFGFEKPRIKVQVKHKVSPAGGPDMRNFIGTLDDGEFGVFVSTSGFKGDARKEVERFNTRMAMYSLEDVIGLLLKYYERLEPEYKTLVPLAQIWVPLK